MSKIDDMSQADATAQQGLERRRLFRGAAQFAALAAMSSGLGGAAPPPKAEPDAPGDLHLGPRTIPAPVTVSPPARQYLIESAARVNAVLAADPAALEPPPASDVAAWKTRIAMVERAFEPNAERMLQAAATVEWREITGVRVAVGVPKEMRHPDRALVQIHGGGFLYLGGRYAMAQAAQMAEATGCTVYSVDYRRAPDHPFPAALDDCLAVYRELLKSYPSKKIAISGESAGGNLSAATTLKARDLGLPLPAAVGMLTPAADLTRQGDTHLTNFGVDTALTSTPKPRAGPDAIIGVYAPGADLKHPYLSPLFGDFTKGFAPVFLQSGTRDILLSDTVRMHRALVRAGVEAELHVWEAMPHGGFGSFTPEDAEVRLEFARFFDKHAA